MDLSGEKYDTVLSGLDGVAALPDPLGSVSLATRLDEGLDLYGADVLHTHSRCARAHLQARRMQRARTILAECLFRKVRFLVCSLYSPLPPPPTWM